jgi:hypothetical protein
MVNFLTVLAFEARDGATTALFDRPVVRGVPGGFGGIFAVYAIGSITPESPSTGNFQISDIRKKKTQFTLKISHNVFD